MGKPVGLREFIKEIEVKRSREKMKKYDKKGCDDDDDNRTDK